MRGHYYTADPRKFRRGWLILRMRVGTSSAARAWIDVACDRRILRIEVGTAGRRIFTGRTDIRRTTAISLPPRSEFLKLSVILPVLRRIYKQTGLK
jgi:hypothetical protein